MSAATHCFLDTKAYCEQYTPDWWIMNYCFYPYSTKLILINAIREYSQISKSNSPTRIKDNIQTKNKNKQENDRGDTFIPNLSNITG